jgi:hypothetical protein
MLTRSDYLRYLSEARRTAANAAYYARAHALSQEEIRANMARLEMECLTALGLPLCHASLTAPPSRLSRHQHQGTAHQ